MFNYDLHVHSNFSDGDFPPAEVFSRAKSAGLKGIVLSDHNITKQFDLINELAQKNGLWTCQGVEITSSFDEMDIHILGYSRNFDMGTLNASLKPIQDGYNERAQIILGKLKKNADIEIDFNKLVKSKAAGVVYRYNIAQAIVALRNIALKDAQKMIGRGGIAWEPYGKWVPKPADIVAMIHNANGIAVLAHPGDMKRSAHDITQTKQQIESLIDELSEQGLDGIEVQHSSHSAQAVTYFRKLAHKHNIIETGGSDWHGETHHPEITMGQAGLTHLEFDLFERRLSSTKKLAA